MSIQEITVFLSKLDEHNRKSWMDEHRSEYAETRKLFLDLILSIEKQIGRISPEFQGTGKTSLYRINRDIRYITAPPYKDHFGAGLTPYVKGPGTPLFYIEINRYGLLRLGMGNYGPPREHMDALRLGIYEDRDEFMQIIASLRRSKLGLDRNTRLVRLPKVFEYDEMSDYIKLKNLVVSQEINVLKRSDKYIIRKSVEFFTATQTLFHWQSTILEHYLTLRDLKLTAPKRRAKT